MAASSSFTIIAPLPGTAVRPVTLPVAVEHPSATITTEGGIRLVLPFAPVEVEHGGIADTYDTLDRPGRKPLLTYTGEGLRTLSFQVLLANRDHQQPVEWMLRRLRRIADSGDGCVVSLSRLEQGIMWQLTDLTIQTLLRQHGTNAVTRATASLSFTEASDATVNIGPLTGGKRRRKGKHHHKGRHRPHRHYTVRKGDTLARIALRMYDDPGKWPRIARANNIRDPRRNRGLRPGRRLTIPPG